MNEQLKKQLARLIKNVEARSQAEKLVVLVILIAAISLIYLSFAYDPMRGEISSLRNQLNSVNAQIASQQASYAAMLAESQQDPNKFANDRLAVVNRQQQVLLDEIASLAGDLVTPRQMTTILTSVLERQSGLELISFRNESAKPLRAGLSNADSVLAETGAPDLTGVEREEVTGQVYEHGLTIEFEGDFFNTLRYLRFLEGITGSFFWDSVRFSQTEWPGALVTLKIHTLSTEEGFIGV